MAIPFHKWLQPPSGIDAFRIPLFANRPGYASSLLLLWGNDLQRLRIEGSTLRHPFEPRAFSWPSGHVLRGFSSSDYELKSPTLPIKAHITPCGRATMSPRYTTIQPSLPVSSIPEAVEYYTGRLGFRLAGRDGDNHCWVQLVDDDSVSKWDVAVNIYLRRMYTSVLSRLPKRGLVAFANRALLSPRPGLPGR